MQIKKVLWVVFLIVVQTVHPSGLEFICGSSGNKDYGFVDKHKVIKWADCPTYACQGNFPGVVYGYGGSSVSTNVFSMLQQKFPVDSIPSEVLGYLESQLGNFSYSTGAGVLLFHSDQENLFLTNVGESRAVLFYHDGSKKTLVHKKQYHIVSEESDFDDECVYLPNGVKVCSALGDFMSREIEAVTDDIKVVSVPVTGDERFLIMATPQFWHAVTRKALTKFIKQYDTINPQELAEELVLFAQERACLKDQEAGNFNISIVSFFKSKKKKIKKGVMNSPRMQNLGRRLSMSFFSNHEDQ